MIKKISLIIIAITIILSLIGCTTIPRTGFAKQLLSVVNLLGYSEDDLNIKIAKDIWNGKVLIVDIPIESNYNAIYNTDSLNQFEIYTDNSIYGDIDYSTELATIISCFAYIRTNKDNADVQTNAVNHEKRTYQLIKDNVKKSNPKVVFKDPRNFVKYLDNMNILKNANSYFLERY